MKKATTKRARKYGKKEEEIIEEEVIKKKRKQAVKVMVDYGMIRNFESRKAAEIYINNKHKESDRNNMPRTSYIFI